MGLFGDSGLLGGAFSGLFGGKTSEEKNLGQWSRAAYSSEDIQRFLPPELRAKFSGPLLTAGMQRIASLLNNPGGISPTIADALRPWLSQESQSIGQNYRNLASNQAGALARGNAPVSIKTALQSALDVAQERAQRQARGEAMTQSEQLRRSDLDQFYKLLDALFQFTSAGRGTAVQGLAAASNAGVQRQGQDKQLTASIIQSLLGG